MLLQDYTIEFEELHHNMQKYAIKLPDEVLAYRYPNSANLSKQLKEIVRATVDDLKYEEMVDQVKKVFNDPTISKED